MFFIFIFIYLFWGEKVLISVVVVSF